MKRILVSSVIACATASCWAAAATSSVESADALALRSECAAQHPVKVAVKAANEYQFVYHKGELRGELKAGQQALACSESQYVAYLDKQDPTRVMAAYPTAAGRPGQKAKPATR